MCPNTVPAAAPCPSTVIFHSDSWIGILRNQKQMTRAGVNKRNTTPRNPPVPSMVERLGEERTESSVMMKNTA
jgi:hypothetical protein